MNHLAPYIGTITAASPAGVDLEYDAVFQQMQRLGEGTQEQQYGETIIPAKSPDWKALLPLTRQLCQRTRDLRVGVLLVESMTYQHGLEGAVDGLRLLVNWVTELWEDVHPSLDASEEGDAFMRVNSLGRLCQSDRLPTLIRHALVLEQPPHFKIVCDDLLVATGWSTSATASSLTPSEIEAVLLAADPDQLQRLFDHFQAIVSALQTIAQTLEHRCGETLWNAETLLGPLQAIRQHLKQLLQQRFQVRDAVLHDLVQPNPSVAGATLASATLASATLASAMHVDPNLVTRSKETVRIGSRDEAFAAIEAVTEYFARHEPSSPVPLLLRRARRIAEQDFIEILRELAPGALLECRQITGVALGDAA